MSPSELMTVSPLAERINEGLDKVPAARKAFDDGDTRTAIALLESAGDHDVAFMIGLLLP